MGVAFRNTQYFIISYHFVFALLNRTSNNLFLIINCHEFDIKFSLIIIM